MRVRALAAVTVVLVLACGGPPLPTVRTAPSSAPTPASAGPTSPTPGPGLAWSEIDLDPAVFAGATVGTVVVGGPGFVAIGREGQYGPPVTWTSPDGERWNRHDQAPWTFGGGVPSSVVARPDGLVALGWGWGQQQRTREPWLSKDGMTWSRSASPARGLGESSEQLAAASESLVAFGGAHPNLFLSEDGRSWHPIPDPEGSLGPDALVSSIVPWGAGLLATGTIRGGDEGAVWTSPDGRSWRLLPRQAAFTADEIGTRGYYGGRVFRLRDGYLITGIRSELGGGARAAWTSADGRDWDVRLEAQPSDAGEVPTGLAALFGLIEVMLLPGMNVGISALGSETGEWRDTMVLSTDGLDWQPVQLPAGAPSSLHHRVVAVADRILLLNVDGSGAARAWWGAPAGAASGPTARGSGGAGGSAAPRSPAIGGSAGITDQAWQRLEPVAREFSGPGGASAMITAVAPYDGGLLALGISPYDIPGYGGLPPPYTALAWRSADGRAWTRAPAQAAFRDARPNGLATRGDVAVAVGTTGARDETPKGVSWRSTDGVRWTRAPVQAALAGATLEDVMATAEGFLAVGSVGGFDEAAQQGWTKPMVWESPDGLRWTQATDVEAEFDEANGWWQSGMRAVISGGPGYVAVGWGTQHGLVWTSVDGQAWTLAPDARRDGGVFGIGAGPPGGGGLADIVVGPQGLVAIGATGDMTPEAAVFTSGDGVAWTRVEVPAELARTDLRGIAALKGGLVVVGGASAGDSGYSRAVVFTSPDGETWMRADPVSFEAPELGPDDVGERLATDVATVGELAVAVGIEDDHAGVWLGASPATLLPTHNCPTGSLGLATLDGMTSMDRVACLGDRELRFRVFIRIEESDKGPYPVVLQGPGAAPAETRFVPGIGTGEDIDWKTGWNVATGHFAEPECARMIGQWPISGPYLPPALGMLECQQSFHVASMVAGR